MPVRGENRDIFYDNCSLHFQPSHFTAPQQSKDKSVFLSYEEKTFVKKAVKISPMQSAGDLLHNLQDTDEAIDFSLKKSVQYHVQKERRGICGSHDIFLQCVESAQLLEISGILLQHADCHGRHSQVFHSDLR